MFIDIFSLGYLCNYVICKNPYVELVLERWKKRHEFKAYFSILPFKSNHSQQFCLLVVVSCMNCVVHHFTMLTKSSIAL